MLCLDPPNSKVQRKQNGTLLRSAVMEQEAARHHKTHDAVSRKLDYLTFCNIIVESFAETKSCSVFKENKTRKKKIPTIKVLSVYKEITGF